MPKARLTYKTNKDDGLIALSVDGVFLTECAYDGDPKAAYEWCKKIFTAGRFLKPKVKNDSCDHNWVSADNEVVKGGVICTKCHAVKAA